MLIYALDDEPLLLEALKDAIAEAEPNAEIHTFSRAKPALREIDINGIRPDVVFLDVEMPGMGGLEFAKCIKDRSQKTNIVFVTGFQQYAAEAAQLYMSGYVMKPVDSEKIRRELDNLRHPIQRPSNRRIRVQCFGNFEVFDGERPLFFQLQRTKELLAYLIDRKGATCTMGELLAVLWEDKPVTASQRTQLRKLIADLRQTMREHGAEGSIIKQRNAIAIDCSQIDCDYYRYLQGDPAVVNLYQGEYMAQYSWAEMSVGNLFL